MEINSIGFGIGSTKAITCACASSLPPSWLPKPPDGDYGVPLLAATGKCGKTAGLEMRLAKRGARNRSWNKTEEDAENEGVEEDGVGRRHTISNRRIYPVFRPPLTEEGDVGVDQLRQHGGGEVAQIAEDQIAGAGHLQDVGSRRLVVAREAGEGDVLHGAVLEIRNPLDFEGGVVVAVLVAGPAEEFGQVLGQPLRGAVLDQDASKRVKGLAGGQAMGELAEPGGDDANQEGLDVGIKPFAQGLLGVSGVGGQADDLGGMFQGEVGFGSDGQQAVKEVGDGDFAWGTFQEPRGPSDRLWVEGVELMSADLEPLLEGVEESRRVG